ncbi:Abi family protein [Chitinophaga agrisoli]|uniref:Abi family protein n=1 Tax=Chitinophaga agrisoli TaxID=2607653 RepID=A0A5B2VJE6_9BACT|nr:Abi family protein [Chitinophaga agrisoli]KAA2239683.1 Abi family protein [Chitinophaga agrisoli]
MAGYFFLSTPRKTMLKFTAPPLTISEQILLLKEKGLIIAEEENAARWLSHVSYFRLKNYTNKFKDAQTGNFVANSNFEQLIKLYLFDRNLKFILFDAIETIEVAIKTLLSNTMAQAHGAHWYMEREHFLPSFDFDEFMAIAEKEAADADELSVRQYRRRYNDPCLPPCWMIVELLSFGAISKMFQHLAARDVKLDICWKYALPDNIFGNWLHCITQLRNRCAHHGRIVYRSMAKTIILPSRSKHRFLAAAEEIDLNSLYATLCCMQHLILKIQPTSLFKTNLITLINNNPHINYDHMGFTPHWRDEAIWK